MKWRYLILLLILAACDTTACNFTTKLPTEPLFPPKIPPLCCASLPNLPTARLPHAAAARSRGTSAPGHHWQCPVHFALRQREQ